MRCLITSIAGIGLSVGAGVPLALADGNTSPGNNAVFASKSSVSLPGCSRTAILTATIKTGKSNHVLMVQAMMLFEGQLPPVTGPAVIDASPTVNGIGMEPGAGPTHFSMTQQCPANVTFCTVSGMFWLDLDARMVKKLDLLESNHGCGLNGLSREKHSKTDVTQRYTVPT